jgi:hypothetical protein
VNNNRTVFVTTLGIADVSSAAAIPDDEPGITSRWSINGVELRFYVDGVLGTRCRAPPASISRVRRSFTSAPNGTARFIRGVGGPLENHQWDADAGATDHQSAPAGEAALVIGRLSVTPSTSASGSPKSAGPWSTRTRLPWLSTGLP